MENIKRTIKLTDSISLVWQGQLNTDIDSLNSEMVLIGKIAKAVDSINSVVSDFKEESKEIEEEPREKIKPKVCFGKNSAYTKDEDRLIIKLKKQGVKIGDISLKLRRSKSAISQRLWILKKEGVFK